MFRAEKEEILDLTLDPNDEGFDITAGASLSASYEQPIADRFGIQDHGWPADKWLVDTVRWAWRTRILVHLGIDLRMRLWQAAEAEAVDVFAANLKDLLLAAPAGQRATMGLDPGFRTGVKVAVIDQTGKAVATHTIYPHVPQNKWDESLLILKNLADQHQVELIAIGNGTASRETDKLAIDLIKANPELNLTKIVVSEAGASVYSASAYASAELPEMDVSLRGAVSIARRLQDPLAELVKIDPKSIGVGQYQHDVTGTKLERSLDAVVEDAVNAVGVDVNTASKPLLARVSGITDWLAGAIVATPRRQGRVRHPRAPARRAAARPEGVRAVRRLPPDPRRRQPARRVRRAPRGLPGRPPHHREDPEDVGALIGDTKTLRGLNPTEFTDEAFGLPTVNDILKELEKPGRDPRPEFQTATFAEGVHTLGDLEAGMVLEGVVTNVAAFGAFVDIGVHQDGLVHVSALSKNFVADPHDVVKSGDVVRVKVLSVDIPRHRISLTMRTDDPADAATETSSRPPRGPRPARASARSGPSAGRAAGPRPDRASATSAASAGRAAGPRRDLASASTAPRLPRPPPLPPLPRPPPPLPLHAGQVLAPVATAPGEVTAGKVAATAAVVGLVAAGAVREAARRVRATTVAAAAPARITTAGAPALTRVMTVAVAAAARAETAEVAAPARVETVVVAALPRAAATAAVPLRPRPTAPWPKPSAGPASSTTPASSPRTRPPPAVPTAPDRRSNRPRPGVRPPWPST